MVNRHAAAVAEPLRMSFVADEQRQAKAASSCSQPGWHSCQRRWPVSEIYV